MNELIEKIKSSEGSPKILKNLYSEEEINRFLNLYKILPTTVHNKKQNVIKKRWLQGYDKILEKLFCERLKNEIGNFKMDNLQTEDGKDIFGLIQESHSPIGLHVDSGFKSEDLIYKQVVTPLSPFGETIISEGIDANYHDIVNYSIFALIQLKEKK